jgi:low affinity Fe/Cu permease
MTNEQLYLAIGVPIAVNIFMFVLTNSRMSDGFQALNKRIDDMKDLWRAELRRVEAVLDVRLKHLEEQR